MKAINRMNAMNIYRLLVRSPGQIAITIEKQSDLAQHNSSLLSEGDVLETNNGRYTDANPSLKLTLAGQMVEQSRPDYITSRFGKLFINIYKGMRTGTWLVSRHYCKCCQ